MESSLGKAFYGVYISSKEIIKNNQRHLFCNMLDLLTRTTKSTGGKHFNLDEFVLFWTTDILPLIFDDDREIQKSAIAAMENVASTLNFKVLHNFASWSDIKMNIVQNYSKDIYKYRDPPNSCWHKIWCILIRILDKEIIKGASTINAFLSIVESGFRSSDYNTRAEAFYCWKVLIEIFAKNNELSSPKRIRLICIPLKSSHSRCTQAAVVKLKVWWYLITKLNVHIEQYVEVILEPFFAFCYGSFNKNNSALDFKEMIILCLISLLGRETKLVRKRMEYFDIENFSGPLINNNIMQKSWDSIITFSVEAINDSRCIVNEGSELSELLFQYVLASVIELESIDALHFLFDKLTTSGNENIYNMRKFVDSCSFTSIAASTSNYNFYAHLSVVICKFLITDFHTSIDAIESVIKWIFLLKSDCFWNILNMFLNEIANILRSESTTGIEIWKLITNSLVTNFEKCYPNDSNSNLIVANQWILWPLKTYSEIPNFNIKGFNDQFNMLLHMTFNSLRSSLNKSIFLKETSFLLEKLYKMSSINSTLNAYFECFIEIFISPFPNKEHDKYLLTITLDILKSYVSQEFNKHTLDLCMKCFKGLLPSFTENDTEVYFDQIKDIWALIINNKKNDQIEKECYNEYRKQFLDEMKKVSSRIQYSKIKNYLENDDLFVIIPSVWSLNPDKLTERQREKFFEKSDIPALYNDMSQSQDAFIKPWTPKKLVIAKGRVEEIVIGERKTDVDKCKTTEFLKINNDPNKSEETSKRNEKTVETTTCKTNTFSEEPVSKKNIFPLKMQEDSSINSSRVTRAKMASLEVDETQNPSGLDYYADHDETIILKDTSSPPDRKQTNNSTSPVLKPKTTHLTGRGAQLINMIRNKKHEAFNSKQVETSTPLSKMESSREKFDTCLNWSNVDTETKPSSINLLVFSKKLPSPCASPSASILKRKHVSESVDDVYDSQAYKRKRVSFHDPPVSITKEYVKDEENKSSSKRCLLLDQELKGATKHLLRRSAKIENPTPNEHSLQTCSLSGTSLNNVKCNLMICEDGNSKNVCTNESTTKPSFPLLFTNEKDVLNYVVNQFPLEEVNEKYLSGEKSDKVKSDLSKFISNYMNENYKFKTTILELLSEKHPKEFLKYAVQENLSSEVCAQLNSNAVIDYICTKSQTNTVCRTLLFQHIHDILNLEKLVGEKFEFLQKVATSTFMTEQQLLSLIELLFESKRKHQRAVSESAIDSSSSL